jgi:hypothetical protein
MLFYIILQKVRLYLTFLDHLTVGEGCPAAMHSSLSVSPSLTVSRLPVGRIETLAGTAHNDSNIRKKCLHVIPILIVKTITHPVLIVCNIVRNGWISDIGCTLYNVHCRYCDKT